MPRNWMDHAELERDRRILAAFALVLCGVVTWEVLSRFRFDLSILSRRRKFKWPMILYFICRISMVLHIFAFAINMNAISKIPCMPVIWISKVTDAIGTTSSSLILALRTYAVCYQDIRVGIPLALLFVGQVILWTQTFRFSQTTWSEQHNQCVVGKTAPRPILVSVFSYTMAFDLIILVLCTSRLRFSSRRRDGASLSTMLLRDGIGYFCAAFSANLLQTILSALALNPAMNLMFLPFALVVSAIAATTVFRHVFELHDAWASEAAPSSYASGGSRARTRSAAMPVFKRPRAAESSGAFTTDCHVLDEIHTRAGADVGGGWVNKITEVEADNQIELGYSKPRGLEHKPEGQLSS